MSNDIERKMIAEWWEVWYNDGHSRIKTGYPGDGKYKTSSDAWEFVRNNRQAKYSVIHVKRYKRQ
jgi:hypothetical protein